MSDRREIVVLGGGGHAKVVISTLHACGFSVVAVFDDDTSKWGSELMGVSIVQNDPGRGGAAVIAMGNNGVRKKFAGLNFRWETAIHPSACVHASVKLGCGTLVFAGAVIQPDTVIGDHVIVNTGATIDHDCVIGDFAHIAPGVHFAGGVQIGEGTFVGIGSAVIQGIKIGPWATLGAGSVVVDNLPGDVVAFGVPAKIRKSNSR